jgi:hypothetical protein
MGFPILGANTASAGDFVTNSLRINYDDAPKLVKTGTSAGSTTFTFSAWVKFTMSDTYNLVFCAGNQVGLAKDRAVSNNSQFYLNGATGGTYTNSDGYNRDPSAWYHLVVSCNSGTGIIYVNNENRKGSINIPQLADDLAIGHFLRTEGVDTPQYNYYCDGYMAEVHFVDGSALNPSSFAETNDNGVWIPKDCKNDLTYGSNGFYLQFKETGTSANASGIGADTSGNDNHFTPTNLAAIDITTDTPQNNFCTLNPLSAGSDMRANGSFKEGNCELVNGGTGGEANGQKCQGTMGFANGKWYWEVKLISNTMTAGIVDSAIQTSSDINLGSKNAVTYDSETGIIANINGNVQGETVSSQYDDGDIIGVAVDADNGFVYFAKNNTYQNSGVPTSGSSGTGGASFTLGNQMLPLAADNSSASVGNHQYNFGNAPFSISSGNTDANGYGNFEYAPPSGYYAVCTKNLAEYG